PASNAVEQAQPAAGERRALRKLEGTAARQFVRGRLPASGILQAFLLQQRDFREKSEVGVALVYRPATRAHLVIEELDDHACGTGCTRELRAHRQGATVGIHPRKLGCGSTEIAEG